MNLEYEKSEIRKCETLIDEWKKDLVYEPDSFFEEMSLSNKSCQFYVIRDRSTDENAKDIGFFHFVKDTCWGFFIREMYRLTHDPNDIFDDVISKFKITSAVVVSVDFFYLHVLLIVQNEIVQMGNGPFNCIRSKIEKVVHGQYDLVNRKAELKESSSIWSKIKDEKMFIPSQDELDRMLGVDGIFLFFEKTDVDEKNLVGLGVIVKSDFFERTSIGMWVNPKFRRKKIGTFILKNMQNKSFEMGKNSSAGCEAKNIGSRKTLQKSGMILRGRYLQVKL